MATVDDEESVREPGPRQQSDEGLVLAAEAIVRARVEPEERVRPA